LYLTDDLGPRKELFALHLNYAGKAQIQSLRIVVKLHRAFNVFSTLLLMKYIERAKRKNVTTQEKR
jgi:hypothetical protein